MMAYTISQWEDAALAAHLGEDDPELPEGTVYPAEYDTRLKRWRDTATGEIIPYSMARSLIHDFEDDFWRGMGEE